MEEVVEHGAGPAGQQVLLQRAVDQDETCLTDGCAVSLLQRAAARKTNLDSAVVATSSNLGIAMLDQTVAKMTGRSTLIGMIAVLIVMSSAFACLVLFSSKAIPKSTAHEPGTTFAFYLLVALAAPFGTYAFTSWGTLCFDGFCNEGYIFVTIEYAGSLVCTWYVLTCLFGLGSPPANVEASSTKPKQTKIQGFVWSVLSVASIAVYIIPPWFMQEGLLRNRVMACALNANMFFTLGATFHIWMTGRSACKHCCWIPFIIQILLMPCMTSDREPFAWQPDGCMNWLDNSSMVFAGICAFCSACCPSIYIERVDMNEAGKIVGGGPVGSVQLPFEAIQVCNALFSVVYLVAVGCDSFLPSSSWLASPVYHISWAMLRRSYVVLFAFYWMKRFPGYVAGVLQAFACGFGAFYFLFWCPLSQTSLSSGHADTCTVFAGSKPTPLGRQFHSMEAAVFILSWVLFYLHGLSSSSSWRSKNSCIAGSIKQADLACFLGFVSFVVQWINPSHDVISNMPSYLYWVACVWGGYFALMIVASCPFVFGDISCDWWSCSVT